MSVISHIPGRLLGEELAARSVCRECRQMGSRCATHQASTSILAFELLVMLDVDEDRLAHCLGVGSQMSNLLIDSNVHPVDFSILATAGVLHDIGYAVEATTGHHAIDGAHWLRAHRFPERVCSLVAWHSTSRYEAAVLGLLDELGKFPRSAAAGHEHDLLWQADFTVDHLGEPTTFTERTASIRARYGADSIPVRALDASEQDMARAFTTTAPRN